MGKIILTFGILVLLLISGCSNKIYGEFKQGVTIEEGFKDWEDGCMKAGGEYKWTYPNHTMICLGGPTTAVFVYEGNNKWYGYDMK